MKIVVLAGGTSTERDVSIVSGTGICGALRQKGHQAILVDVFCGQEEVDWEDPFPAEYDVEKAAAYIRGFNLQMAELKKTRKNFFGPNVIDLCKKADFVFLGLHGANGEDGKLQGAFDLMGIPYTGTGYLSSAMAMDKGVTKAMFQMRGVPTPAGKAMKKKDRVETPQELGMDFPVVVKTCCGGSSIGVYIVDNQEDYTKALDGAFTYENEVVVEEFVEGVEYTVAVVDGKAYPVVQIVPVQGFYDYENKYYFSASFRRDGSSRLSRESRWGDFWSVSGSWRITSESFMENIKEVITDAKLRASYGVNGTQPSDYYGYLGVFGFGYNYNKGAGSAENRIENPNMKWEKNYATNIGLDLTLWNRLALTFEWYNRETKDLLMDRAISAVPGIIDGSGIANTLMNVGSMRNRGFEFEIKSTNIQNNNLTWTTTFNISHNKNKLTKLDGEQNEMISGVSIHRIGEPYYSIYAYEYAGVDPATGKELYYINGEDGSRETTTNSAQANKTIIGSVEPTVQGGLTNFVSWKFIDFNMTLTYSLGGHAYDYATWLQSNGGTYNYLGNVPAYYKIEDTWKKPGDNAKLPQFAYGNTNIASSRWLMSTDHLRIKNITLGFTMPSKVSQKWGINKLRAFVSANNLLTWKSDGLYVDPETPVDGLCTFETPALRTITFGLEVGF
mgnify:CR=1 FL=1